MIDAKERLTGSYECDGENVTLRFHGGALIYTGKTSAHGASGKAFDEDCSWSWNVRRNNAVPADTEKAGERGPQVSGGIPWGYWAAFAGLGGLAVAGVLGVLILWRSSLRLRQETFALLSAATRQTTLAQDGTASTPLAVPTAPVQTTSPV